MNAINGDSSTPKRRKLTDFIPEVPASDGPHPSWLARLEHTYTRVTVVPSQLFAGDETGLLIIRHAS